ncbi:MAG: thioredoxin family protein [Bacteroidetes bacterium]|nr:thioredoxin family protein [Bacteroidota bacterium]
MKKSVLTIVIALLAVTGIKAQGYTIGDAVDDFTLENIDQKMISLYSYEDATNGAIVIFTCNHCPYAKAYEDRIIAIDNMFREKGYPVIAINPNDPALQPEDSFDKMIERAKEKGFPFPYLFDETQEIYKNFGAKRTPHVYLLNKEDDTFVVSYIGTIDNNYKDESEVDEKYLANAVNALLDGEKPDPDFTKAIGCTIKDKNYKK